MGEDKGMTTGRGAVQRADAAQRAQRAWALREAGQTWDEVAQLVGYANGANAVRGVRTYFGELPQPQREDLRELWRNRLERLYGLADRDAEQARPGALRAGVAIAQRAAQLDGLDAPTQVVVSPAAQEFEQVVATLVAARGGSQVQEADIFAEDVEVVDVEEVDE